MVGPKHRPRNMPNTREGGGTASPNTAAVC